MPDTGKLAVWNSEVVRWGNEQRTHKKVPPRARLALYCVNLGKKPLGVDQGEMRKRRFETCGILVNPLPNLDLKSSRLTQAQGAGLDNGPRARGWLCARGGSFPPHTPVEEEEREREGERGRGRERQRANERESEQDFQRNREKWDFLAKPRLYGSGTL